MRALAGEIDSVAAETGFSGVVHVDLNGETQIALARGLADRRHEVPITLETQFGIASGTKGLTATVVVDLVERGVLELGATARGLLGDDLPLIDDGVTIEHLLSHQSGIGDYLDEEADLDPADYLLAAPAHELATTEAYLTVLDGHRTKFPAGARFSYSNSGYVVLALLAERASGVPFHDLVVDRICAPAGMEDTAFLRSDELPGRAALGYVEVDGAVRTNVFHLPVRGSGDGGIYSTAHDVARFWRALFGGEIVSSPWVAELMRPRSGTADSSNYGLGFWLEPDGASLEGCDAGVSFRSVHLPARGITHTVISNTSNGAWPITRLLDERLSE